MNFSHTITNNNYCNGGRRLIWKKRFLKNIPYKYNLFTLFPYIFLQTIFFVNISISFYSLLFCSVLELFDLDNMTFFLCRVLELFELDNMTFFYVVYLKCDILLYCVLVLFYLGYIDFHLRYL